MTELELVLHSVSALITSNLKSKIIFNFVLAVQKELHFVYSNTILLLEDNFLHIYLLTYNTLMINLNCVRSSFLQLSNL